MGDMRASQLRSVTCGELTYSGSLRIGRSGIHGFGVFAEQELEPGDVLFVTRNYKVLSVPVYASVQRSTKEHLIGPPPLRWLNHGCKPNAKVFFEGQFVGIATIANMSAGDEITCDYMATEDRIPLPFRCLCGKCPSHLIMGRHKRSVNELGYFDD